MNTKCFLYKIIDLQFARKHNLLRINISFRFLKNLDNSNNETITKIAVVKMNINSYTENKAYLYVILKFSSYDIILELL